VGTGAGETVPSSPTSFAATCDHDLGKDPDRHLLSLHAAVGKRLGRVTYIPSERPLLRGKGLRPWRRAEVKDEVSLLYELVALLQLEQLKRRPRPIPKFLGLLHPVIVNVLIKPCF